MKKQILIAAFFALLIIQACKNTGESLPEDVSEVKTPVMLDGIQHLDISEYIQLSATSAYLKKNQLKANITGYIEQSFASPGDYIEAGKPLYYIRSKEAEALSRFHSKDTSNAIKGLVIVRAPESGILTEVFKYANDYVTDGDAMATIAQQNSFVFLLNVPFESRKYAATGTRCTILLPDSTRVYGTIASQLSLVDPVSQTQSYEIKIAPGSKLPENLIAAVQLVKRTSRNAQVIGKSSVLTDETMENFWVMKMINDSTAVKVPITKGIAEGDKIEIISPVFTQGDRILSSGQYGLSDTAFVKTIK